MREREREREREGKQDTLKVGQNLAQCSVSTHLEQKGVSEGVAEAEDKVLLWVFGHGLHDAALRPHGVLWDAVVVDPGAAVRLVEEQRASWEGLNNDKGNQTGQSRNFTCSKWTFTMKDSIALTGVFSLYLVE